MFLSGRSARAEISMRSDALAAAALDNDKISRKAP
jgi:hypothetical protein